jgi:hypothetical protein
VVVPLEKLAEVIREIDSEIKHPFILEGFATDRKEFVLWALSPTMRGSSTSTWLSVYH